MIIFDFDQTLVDTRSTEHLRSARRWQEVMRVSANLEPYAGVTELLKDLDELKEELAIVTNSPNMVPKSFATRYAWPLQDESILGYHQVPSGRRKPDPEGLLRALKTTTRSRENEMHFHVGDAPEDTEASRRAGIVSIGAGWGARDIASLYESAPDHLFMSVFDLHDFFLSTLGAS